MFDKHKRESLLLRDLLKKLIIIVIGSIVAAYGITLAIKCNIFCNKLVQCFAFTDDK